MNGIWTHFKHLEIYTAHYKNFLDYWWIVIDDNQYVGKLKCIEKNFQ